MVQPRGKAQRGEQLGSSALSLGAGLASDQLRQDHVFQRIEIGQQVMELIDEANVFAAQGGAPAGRLIGRFDPGNPDGTAKAAFEQADRLQHGRLAGAGRAEQGDDFAGADFQIDALEDVDANPALFEAAGNAAKADNRLIHSAAPARDRCSPPSMPDRAWRRTTGQAP